MPPVFSSIVVGTDGSSTAETAVERAMLLASQTGAKLSIVCAFDPEAGGGRDGETGGSASTAAVQVLQRAVSRAKELEVTDVETFDVGAQPADAIIDVAERIGADLVVVGNKGMSGGRRFLLGSVPNNVSHHAPCSVLIVHTS